MEVIAAIEGAVGDYVDLIQVRESVKILHDLTEPGNKERFAAGQIHRNLAVAHRFEYAFGNSFLRVEIESSITVESLLIAVGTALVTSIREMPLKSEFVQSSLSSPRRDQSRAAILASTPDSLGL